MKNKEMKKPAKTRLKFETSEAAAAAKHRRLMLLFIALVILLATASGVVLWKEYGTPKTKSDSGYSNKTNMQKNVSILFGGATTEGNLAFLSTVSMNTETGVFTVRAVSPQQKYNGKTYNQIYGQENADAASEANLKTAVGKNTNTKIDRFVIVGESNMGKFVTALGYYKINLPKTIDYSSNDFSLHLIAGEHVMSGSDLFSYLRYVGLGYSDAACKKQASVIADFIGSELTESNTAEGQTLFSTLIDLVDSDISINDYVKYSSFLTAVSKDTINITVVS